MAEKSIFWTTGETGDGISPYTQEDLFRWLRAHWNGAQDTVEGVNPKWTGALQPTLGGNTVYIASGAATIVGVEYYNDTSVSFEIPFSVSSQRIDSIVVRVNWAEQTARLTRIPGTEGLPSPISPVQNYGTLYDLPICVVAALPASIGPLADTREFVHAATRVNTDMIDDHAVTSVKLSGAALTTDVLSAELLTPSETLVSGNDIGRLYVPGNLEGGVISKCWATLATPATSGTTYVKFVNVTDGQDVATVTISPGSYSGSVTCSYTVSAYDLLRMDVTFLGAGAKGLAVQVQVILP